MDFCWKDRKGQVGEEEGMNVFEIYEFGLIFLALGGVLVLKM